MPNTINHDDIQYSSDQDNPTLSNPAFSPSSALTPPHPPPHRVSIWVQSAGVVSPGNRQGNEHRRPRAQTFCNPNALQLEIRDQIFMQRVLIVWNYLTKGLICGGAGRGTNMRVIQKSPFKSEYWSFTEGRDSLCSCYHPPSVSASLSCWGGGRGSGVKVGPFPFRWQESSRPLPQTPLPVGNAQGGSRYSPNT